MTASLDDAFASPVRLRICGHLAGCDEADFKAVMDYCGLTSPHLSKNITTLSDLGYVQITKVPSGRYTKTRLCLTDHGRATLASHVTALQEIAAAAQTEPTKAS